MQNKTQIELLDIGGEGRHETAWNLNPRSKKTIGPDKGRDILRLIHGRAERIPLPDACVLQIMMERAPLRRAAIFEMIRVIVPGGTIILRHHAGTGRNPHVVAQQLIDADCSVQQIKIGCQGLQQTCFENVRQVRTTIPSNQLRGELTLEL
ncbi:MAG: hypothetical protein IT422_10040 [Pirellulaceae bacterium]|nr:hypothetical protein [Pirellulaceae bacterium]